MVTMQRMKDGGVKVDCILTSPPYNTNRNAHSEYDRKTRNGRYDIYNDRRNEMEYGEWTAGLFNMLDNVLVDNGVVLYNISYGNEQPNSMWFALNNIIANTPFMIADVIAWKKTSAMPSCENNKLTRICEFVYVFCRKNEYNTFATNKQVVSVRPTGQKMYSNFYNFVYARNNDGSCDLNKATYSTELCDNLLYMYAKDGSLVYDPFIGTGTTAVSCKKRGLNFIGSELSPAQCDYANCRISGVSISNKNTQLTIF